MAIPAVLVRKIFIKLPTARISERKELKHFFCKADEFCPFHAERAFLFQEDLMEKRIGVIAIVVENLSSATDVNTALHEFSDIIVGRMGIPYRERGISVISVIVDGSNDRISAMTGKIGRIPFVSVKTALAK